MNVIAWPSQNPDVNPIENQENAVKTKPQMVTTNLTKLKQLCKRRMVKYCKVSRD